MGWPNSRRTLMSGNQAIARGAYEAGVAVACGYPGTPSTEILEHMRSYDGIYVEWSPNEKVALEVALGAAMAGVRSVAAMKHVGLNVAADPLFTAAYAGVNAGLVVISADDPGMHSSQNEQDNRHYARFAKIPMLEPSDAQEAKDLVGLALKISEEFDTPVLLRTTTRISHSSGIVRLAEPVRFARLRYEKNPVKRVMVPGNARLRRLDVERRISALEAFADSLEANTIEWKSASVGIIASGVSYQYAREVMGESASYLKLAMTNPIARELVREFASRVRRLYVVEEGDAYLEDQIRAMGIEVAGKRLLPAVGELTPEIVRRALAEDGVAPTLSGSGAGGEGTDVSAAGVRLVRNEGGDGQGVTVPARPPVMCPGCPHRAAMYALRKLKTVAAGDIGCYTLGAAPPISALDTTICMGASVGNAIGFDKAGASKGKKPVAVIGDSTFVHSGITGLIDAVYNQAAITVLILDNGTTAMTGHQDHPATGITLRGKPSPRLSLEDLARAVGVERVTVVDPYDLSATEGALREASGISGPAVVIARRPCALLPRARAGDTCRVLEERCTGCGLCLELGCPAMRTTRDRRPAIAASVCAGCGVCARVCRSGAIRKAGEDGA